MHDNSSIYIDKKIEILELSERVIHEFIHAIQTVKDKRIIPKKWEFVNLMNLKQQE